MRGTIHLGKWRYRLTVELRRPRAVFAVRDQFPEGTVYRLMLGPLFVKVMADALSPARRHELQLQARQALRNLTS